MGKLTIPKFWKEIIHSVLVWDLNIIVIFEQIDNLPYNLWGSCSSAAKPKSDNNMLHSSSSKMFSGYMKRGRTGIATFLMSVI